MIPFEEYKKLIEAVRAPSIFGKPTRRIIICSRGAGKSTLHALFFSKKTKKKDDKIKVIFT